MDDLTARLEVEPALAWKAAVLLGGADPDSAAARAAARAVRSSPIVTDLLAGRDRSGRAYRKWTGSHWVLSLLADLGCTPGDESLRPLMEETFACWLGDGHAASIPVIDGRADELARRLLEWQWPDGGWNCDKRPEADMSSFMETLIPLRALGLYARVTGDPRSRLAAERAAEVFLTRKLFRRRRGGRVINPNFIRLHFPCYWHYDILFGLKVLAEAGFVGDPRCGEALDLLESRRLPDGGFPAEATYSRPTRPALTGYMPVSWGGTSWLHLNPFVTADALYVLRAAGRSH